MPARVLIVSPIPTHPQDQGNSSRIYALGRLLQSAGVIVHFLYYQAEGLTAAQRAAMQACWDHFHVVPCKPDSMPAPADGVAHWLDDWWEPEVGEVAAQLHRRWRFRAVIANYVWFSGVLEAFGTDVLKVLDTHDVFGGRADRFKEAGLPPEWFYTTFEEEARGLARADIVLAIQDEEAQQFRALGPRNVLVVGHLSPARQRLPRQEAGSRVTAGYIASGNPINVASFERMSRRLAAEPVPGKRFVVAGSICGRLGSDVRPFERIGRVDHLDDFYDLVDLVVNPMPFGTGLKIKSVEAVCQGLPLIATEAAMVGLPSRHPLHRLGSPEDVADRLRDLDAGELVDLASASFECAAAYGAGVRSAIRQMVSLIEGVG
jgi:hypothetical protein